GNVIEFSGDAGKVAAAFHTEIHRYVVRGRAHWANAGDPAIPAALAPAVAGIVSLNDFPRHPQHVVAGVFKKQRDSALATPVQPAFTTQCSGGGSQTFPCYGLGPYDFATIYNLLPLWNAGIDGTGWTLAIVGESDVNTVDITNFRSMFGMPAPVINVIHNGPTPGIVPGDETESDLDLEWAGGIARGAAIDFVVSASTDTTSGIDLSSEYIVDNDLAPVMSVSYGACELAMGTAGNQFYDQLWQQAAAEGISVFVAAGDAGSAVCDSGQIAATHGLSVSGVASPPNAVAVGGTDFQDFNNGSTYWSSTNNATTQASAKSYIPEITWNDSCTNSLWELVTNSTDPETNCNNAQLLQYKLGVMGGSGGASNCTTSDGLALTSCTGGYAKPAWQPGNDGRRDLPDVSLFAGDGLENVFYILCEFDAQGYCQGGQYSQFLAAGGTSASAPAWAAIQLLVDQKLGVAQGDPHYVLYHLASQQPASGCAANLPPGATCIFPDITVGTIAQPCSTGTPNCTTKGPTDQYGVLSGFNAAAGFDLATGLGSANIDNLVNAWSAVTFAPAKATLTLNPTSGITHGAPVAVTIGVAAQNTGGGTPTGLVSLLAASGQEAATFSLASGAVSGTTSDLPGGTYAVHAHYPGDGVFAPADSAPVTVTVAPEASNTTAQVLTADANGNPIAITSQPYGQFAYLRADVAGASKQGVPTGTVTFSVNGQAFGSAIPLNSEGTAATPNGTFLLPGGTDALTAQYSGDASFNAGTSPPVSFTITPGPTSLSLNFSTNISVGVNGFCDVTINTQSHGAGPTGTFTIQNGGKTVGSPVPVSGATSVANGYISSLTTLNIPASALNVGLNSITVAYSGDPNYAPATAPPGNIDVQIPTVMALSSSATTINQNGSVTFTAKVTPSQSGPAPMSGTVMFSGIQGFLGSVPIGSGQVQFTASKLPVGTSYITATYSGDVNYQPATKTLGITVNPDLTLAAAAPSVIVPAPGGSGTDALTATFASGFSGSAQF
ncbi:MAG TPA: Ig-like domain repeat protein, partial [Pirellulales bacterium]|nr:Ig-like domain repeat protein [Pirellulales bacterium]